MSSKNFIKCYLKIKSEPFLVDLKIKSELFIFPLFDKRGKPKGGLEKCLK